MKLIKNKIINKIVIVLSLILLSFTANGQTNSQNDEVLTNSSIIQLKKIGLSNVVIINKINHSATDFDVSDSGLVLLKKDSISNEVIDAILAISKKTIKPEGKENETSHHPLYPKIYFLKSDNAKQELKCNKYSIVKKIGRGIQKQELQFYNPNASTVIISNQPTFYITFDNKNHANRNSDLLNFKASVLNNFVLFRLNINHNANREMTLRINRGSNKGIYDVYAINFDFEMVSDSVYKIFFKTPLPNGEYCFFRVGEFMEECGFDFSINTSSEPNHHTLYSFLEKPGDNNIQIGFNYLNLTRNFYTSASSPGDNLNPLINVSYQRIINNRFSVGLFFAASSGHVSGLNSNQVVNVDEFVYGIQARGLYPLSDRVTFYFGGGIGIANITEDIEVWKTAFFFIPYLDVQSTQHYTPVIYYIHAGIKAMFTKHFGMNVDVGYGYAPFGLGIFFAI